MERELIIHLIAQDIKHNMLTLGLENLRLTVDHYDLDIISAVAGLMGIEKGKMTDDWGYTYHAFMIRAVELRPDHKVEGLDKLATECYQELLKISSDQ